MNIRSSWKTKFFFALGLIEIGIITLPTPLTGAEPVAAKDSKLTYLHHRTEKKTCFYSGKTLLAVYRHRGNTFTEFWRDGVNLIGGFSSGPKESNHGGANCGHSEDYPFGWIDAHGGKPEWEGFWSGFNYVDRRWGTWQGVAGNPFAEQSHDFQVVNDKCIQLHVVLRVGPLDNPLFKCDVRYYVSRNGIGVKNVVTVLRKLQPMGYDDTGGQFLKTQIDCDLDPSRSYKRRHQPDLYYKLALDNQQIDINPFPPKGGYNRITPSNIYADQLVADPPEKRVHLIPNSALVTSKKSISFLTPLDRPSRKAKIVLRVDLKRSRIPPLEYYCEYNGERDYLNYLYSAALGRTRKTKTVSAGTRWTLYGDLIYWTQNKTKELYRIRMLCEDIP